MCVTCIAPTSAASTSALKDNQKIHADLQALRSDLQSGSLAAAHADFDVLMSDMAAVSSAESPQNGVASAFLGLLTSALGLGDFSQLGDGAAGGVNGLHQGLWHPRHTGVANAHESSALDRLLDQPRADFDTLSTAVKNGNLTAAQAALEQLKVDDPAVAQAIAKGDPADPVGTQFLALQAALGAGDAAAAQAALAVLSPDSGSWHGHRRGA